MNKNYSIILFFLLFSIGIQKKIISQSVVTTVQYNGAQSLGCCTVCGNDYWCINNVGGCGTSAACDTRTFMDPVPAGNIVTSITVSYYSAGCYGNAITATIAGNVFPTTNEANTGCLCSNNPCGLSASSTSSFPCGIPGYVYGGTNSIKVCTGADICMDRVELTLTYAPSSQSTPANQPSAISGSSAFCPGVPQTFSIPAVANASSYIWSVPAGWTINSGQGTTSINATPGTAGSICVIAHNLCGNSAQTCFAVVLNTPSSAPASASATPPSVCGSGSSNLALSGGSLGTGAGWEWYSGSCGGTLVGTGSSITVSTSSTTTYFVRAVGSCNITACASVMLTVNPIPTANAGSTNVLTCSTPNVVLGGSGGGSYTWSGPGIVSGGGTANPTINQPGTYSLIVTSSGCNSPVSTVNITQNITPPSASAAAAGTSVLDCNVTSLSLNSTPTSGVTYSWSGPGIISGGTTANPVVNQPGSYSLIVTNTSNGCSNSSSPAAVSVTQNVTPPSATASTNSVVTCASTAVNLSSAPAGLTYTWTAPSGSSVTSGSNSQNATGLGGGTYTVTVKNTANGCSTNTTVVIPQNITPPAGVTAASGGTLTCSTTTVSLSGTPGTGVTYSWAGPGIVSGATTANPIVNQAGNYSLTVTNASNGCSNASPAIANVAQNGTVPPANITVTGSITCTTPSLTLTGSASAGSTYSWSGPGIISGGTTNTPVVSQPGTYVFNVTNTTSGCVNSATATVSQNSGSPSPVISAAGNHTLTCTATVLTLTATPASGVSYSWTGPGIVSGGTTANPTVNQPGTYSLIVTNTTNGCSNSVPVTVAISQNTTVPVVTITAAAGNASITCAVSSITLSATPATGVNYTWSGPGVVSGGTTSSPVVNVTGNYSVTVTNTATGCSNITGGAGSVINVPIDTIHPSATINAASASSITCTNTLVTINATASSAGPSITYSWTTSSGTISGGANTNSPSITGPGIYTLTVLNTVNGCLSTSTVAITSNVVLPTGVTAGNDTLLPCNSNSLTLQGYSSSPNVTYTWHGPGNYVFTGQNADNVVLPGQYILNVKDNITGCNVSDTLSVSSQSVDAGFTADPTTGITPLLVNFTNTSAGAATYSWDFNDGHTSTAVNPSNTFQNAGTYTVVLTAENSLGTCSGTATTIIIVDDGLTMEIPNVFTPNDDGKNDVFTIKSTGVKEISLQIFNRWGEKLFEFTGARAAWDGMTPQGGKVPDATYFYFVKATGFNNKVIEKQGTVNLFR